MSAFWMLIFTHVACVFAGAFITRNPERVKGWIDGLLSKLTKKAT